LRFFYPQRSLSPALAAARGLAEVEVGEEAAVAEEEGAAD
jgi:hypothetical protein